MFLASLVAQMVKNLPAMQETWIWSLGWEDPLEKGMATRSSILVWRIPCREEPGGLQSMGSQSQTQLSKFHFLYCIRTSISSRVKLLAWRIPGSGEPGGLLSLRSHRVGHDWSDLAAAAAAAGILFPFLPFCSHSGSPTRSELVQTDWDV